jgi:hypothetical protein
MPHPEIGDWTLEICEMLPTGRKVIKQVTRAGTTISD